MDSVMMEDNNRNACTYTNLYTILYNIYNYIYICTFYNLLTDVCRLIRVSWRNENNTHQQRGLLIMLVNLLMLRAANALCFALGTWVHLPSQRWSQQSSDATRTPNRGVQDL